MRGARLGTRLGCQCWSGIEFQESSGAERLDEVHSGAADLPLFSDKFAQVSLFSQLLMLMHNFDFHLK